MLPEATPTTTHKNKSLLKKLNFNNTNDFILAKKGFIASLDDNGIVKNKNGDIIWDVKSYTDFIKPDSPSPDSVNPSLWRQSQLNLITGLFKVCDGVYQVRGLDLSNMTFVEGKNGVTIYDPLISVETARAALKLYRKHVGARPIKAIIYSHSHIDHFGGVSGLVSKEDVKSGRVAVYAPEGFMKHAVEENVYAGIPMGRRAIYGYGSGVGKGPRGTVGSGLGIGNSTGAVSLIKPTVVIKKQLETHVIDGIKNTFYLSPGAEAPSEMMWYIPSKKLINVAEEACYNMHNIYTLRGAKVRDALSWSKYLNDIIKIWGSDYEYCIAMHHWPTWGNEEITKHIKSQRDTYKFIHDQALHYANMGYVADELPSLVKMPKTLTDIWGTHGYYGSLSHNVRAVYNFYLGFFDGNPSHLDPIPPSELGKKYVDAIGGPDKVYDHAKKAFDEGDYKWCAVLLNHAVFAGHKTNKIRRLLANALSQQGYQAESGPWRNFFLTGAKELLEGIDTQSTSTNVAAIRNSITVENMFDWMSISLDAKKSEGKNITINWNITENGKNKRYVMFLENCVLNFWENRHSDNPDVTVDISKKELNQMINDFEVPSAAKISDPVKFKELTDALVNFEKFMFFNIVES
ncbi:alkyl/aryl-sulfatase [Tetraselmis virus 1]|uniref:Alkyl/aryl-sulfatase n=1 Tax=Tetraselmis virus 1 TaxID=2060617 RepID=A0A2P0VMX1_9VIRU|nr:alkyl/aryl-sulfatase [Tetraselmis virus 1]AUF82241.1 alkyl/aryl-sulfatase [Tetraselmis virus 1]